MITCSSSWLYQRLLRSWLSLFCVFLFSIGAKHWLLCSILTELRIILPSFTFDFGSLEIHRLPISSKFLECHSSFFISVSNSLTNLPFNSSWHIVEASCWAYSPTSSPGLLPVSPLNPWLIQPTLPDKAILFQFFNKLSLHSHSSFSHCCLSRLCMVGLPTSCFARGFRLLAQLAPMMSLWYAQQKANTIPLTLKLLSLVLSYVLTIPCSLDLEWWGQVGRSLSSIVGHCGYLAARDSVNKQW